MGVPWESPAWKFVYSRAKNLNRLMPGEGKLGWNQVLRLLHHRCSCKPNNQAEWAAKYRQCPSCFSSSPGESWIYDSRRWHAFAPPSDSDCFGWKWWRDSAKLSSRRAACDSVGGCSLWTASEAGCSIWGSGNWNRDWRPGTNPRASVLKKG